MPARGWLRRSSGTALRLSPVVLNRGAIRRASVVAAVVVGGLVGWQALQSDGNRVPDGTEIGDVDVGGLSPEVARAAVRRHAQRVSERGVSITINGTDGGTVHVSGQQLGARPLIDEAFRAAEDRGALNGLLDRIGFHRTRHTRLRFALDEKRVADLVERVRRRAGTPPRPATVRLDGGRVIVVAGKRGVGFDETSLREALVTLPAAVELDARTMDPPVSVEQARQARGDAQALVDSPPTVVSTAGRRFALPASLVAEALRFTPGEGEVRVSLHPPTLAGPLGKAFPDVDAPQRDAEFVVKGKRVTIRPEKAGVKIDADKVAAEAVTMPGGDVALATAPVPPKTTAAELRGLNIHDVVSEYTTQYPCCEARTTNIARAAQILDGTIIPAGARFSMNEAVGERTVERGFVAAPQIANGKFEQGVGGGTSQVATTLYNAAFFAGLDIVAHQPHEVYISRYPMGREATISWTSPDLVFRNDWEAPIFLRVRTSATSVTVQMLSRSLGRRVTTSTGEPAGRIEPKIVRTFDPSLEPGSEVVDQSMGGSGFSITYTRQVYRGSQRLSDETFSWSYRAVDALVRYGPEVPESTTPSTPETPDSPPPPATPTVGTPVPAPG